MIHSFSESDIDQFEQLKMMRFTLHSMLEEINESKLWGFKATWENFMAGMVFLNPQSYGFRIENRLRFQLDAIRNNATSNNGDFQDIEGNNYECKTSVLTTNSSQINLVQIRPWQNTDYYCIFFDMRNKGFKPYCFKLTAEEMKQELFLNNGTAAHGTLAANKVNRNIEYRFSFNLDDNDKTFRRWKEKYLVDFDFDAKVDIEEYMKREKDHKQQKALETKRKNEAKRAKAREDIIERRNTKENNKKIAI
jgi:hypothetical protein